MLPFQKRVLLSCKSSTIILTNSIHISQVFQKTRHEQLTIFLINFANRCDRTTIFASLMAAKKTDRLWKLLIVCIGVSISVMLFLWGYEWWISRRAHYIRYDEFGIEIPTNYSVHGIDVSKYQRVIDWQSVKAMNVDDVQINFAFIKATEGNINEDKYFSRNWKMAKSANVVRGAYHFFIATKSGRTQAENFISSVDLEPGDLPPVLGIEQTYGVPIAKLQPG